MKKSIVSLLIMCVMLTLAPAVLAAEYEAMPEIDVTQYQTAPTVQVQFDTGTVQEIPEKYVLQMNGKTYLAAKAFSLVPGLAAYEQLNGQPVAVISTFEGEDIMIYCKVQQPSEEKPFFVGNDGNTYLPLRDTCTEFGIKLTHDNNIITLKR